LKILNRSVPLCTVYSTIRTEIMEAVIVEKDITVAYLRVVSILADVQEKGQLHFKSGLT